MNLYSSIYKVEGKQGCKLAKILFCVWVVSNPFQLSASEFEISLVSYPSLYQQSLLTPLAKEEHKSEKHRVAEHLYAVLSKHYKIKPSDPYHIQADLKEMAEYYSQFPKVVELFVSLELKDWTLNYNENTWSTIAAGSVLNVESAKISFNTRSAAKLKFHNSCKDNSVCIASPADALLHEILHVHSMLVDTKDFIKQGGMNRFRYPYQHEYAVIQAENSLYASMSKVDGIKRPQRNEHSGKKIIAHCATCIK